jgi:transcriptional regulator with XRE-family HTH domain
MNTLGSKLKQLRENLGLTQAEFSKKVKLSQSAISQFEDEKRHPSTKALEKISEACNVSIDTLLGKSPIQSNDPEKDLLVSHIVSNLKNIDTTSLKSLNRFIGETYLKKTDREE